MSISRAKRLKYYSWNIKLVCRSQWPRGPKCGSPSARWLGLRVRIRLAAWMDVWVVSVVCCQVEVSATSWSLVRRSPTGCGVSECDIQPRQCGGLGPAGGCRESEIRLMWTIGSTEYTLDVNTLVSLFTNSLMTLTQMCRVCDVESEGD